MYDQLTVAVIVYNKPLCFEKFMESYEKYLAKDTKLLVIDNSSVKQDIPVCDDYIKSSFNKPLAYSLNNGIIYSSSRFVMLCSDDIEFLRPYEEFAKLIKANTLSLYRNWSCMIIDKAIIPKVGWFDIRYTHAGWDGADYYIRLKIHNVSLLNHTIDKMVFHHGELRKKEYPAIRWNYFFNREFYFNKWNFPYRNWYKTHSGQELQLKQKIRDIDWFPSFTQLYKQKIWNNSIPHKGI